MRITRDHSAWGAASVAVTAAAAGVYALNLAASPHGPSGGSAVGLTYGILGTLCMFLAAFLSLRRKLMPLRLGSAQLWMKIHLWLGALAVPLILLHAGFRLGGALTTTLMALFALVIASGVFGLVVQNIVPRRMTAQVPLETVYGQIDHVLGRLALDAYEVVAAITGSLPEAAEEQEDLAREQKLQARIPGNWKEIARLRPAAAPPPAAAVLRNLYLDYARPYLRAGGRGVLPPDLFAAAVALPEEWIATVQRLAELCEECRQLRQQQRLHQWLHAWLFLHAPVSLALLVLALVHAVYALRFW